MEQKRFNRVFVTGDLHASLDDLRERVGEISCPSKNDLLVILGDCGFFLSVFYDMPELDFERQRLAAQLPITILCVQGNHEQPFKEMNAQKIDLLGGKGYVSNGIYFAHNGSVLNINGKSCLVVGGASSVDRDYRIEEFKPWWENEELSPQEFYYIVEEHKGKHFDHVFSHTCPYNFMPREAFLSDIDQNAVSNITEFCLQKLHDSITFCDWHCGHFHIEKSVNTANPDLLDEPNLFFLYHSVKQIN